MCHSVLTTIRTQTCYIRHCYTHSCLIFSVSSSTCGKADLVFVLDASNSVPDGNWEKLIEFGADVTMSLVIGPDETRVACVTYADKAWAEWTLGGENFVLSLKEMKMCAVKI